MNCKQFQEVLPHIIESGGSAEEEAHLSSCQACSDLVRDLKYIAEQAKLLLPMRDPSPKVWTNIEQSLQREGLLREGRMSRQGQIKTIDPTKKKSWTPLGLAIALVAVVALGVVVVNYRSRPLANGAEASSLQTSDSAQFNNDDQMLISQVSQQAPEVRQAYEDGLRQANAYIADAQKAVIDDPEDSVAQQHLVNAYQQKAMLYDMGTGRALP